MASRASSFLRCLGALMLLTATTWAVEIPALLFVWRHQTLPPYAFFPNQSYDFLAKIRWFAGALFDWAPGLPDRFAGLAVGDKLSALAPLLPSTLVVAAAVGVIGGALCALVSRRRGTLRGDLLLWAALALVVHVAVSIPAFSLDEGLRISRLAYRARSLVVDGMLLATAVSLVAWVLAWSLAPLFSRSRALTIAGLVTMVGASALAMTNARPAPAAKAAASAPSAGAHRNVVLISLDSLRADHVGAWGYKRDTTPNLDWFAKESVRFRNAISTSSWTLPTHLTMFTGRSQLSHGVVVDTNVLPTSVRTLGEIFHDAGYATAGFVSGPYVSGHYGYDRGMDTYIDLSAQWGKGAEARAAVLSPQVNEKGLAWLDETHEKPFFLFLHYFDIHYDYVPPPPYDTMFDPGYTGTMDGRMFIERDDVNPKMPPRDLEHILALYDGEIRFTDEHVGRVLDRLREKGLLDSTAVMIVADHGDEFFEHGNKGHHRTVYDEVLHVPMLLRLPGGEHAGETIDAQTSLLDVFPTLLDAAGLAAPEATEGESLAGWIRGSTSTRTAVFSDFYDKRGFNLQVSRRTPDEKTIQHFNRITHPKQGALEDYDLAGDPAEKSNRARSRRAEVASAVEAMTAWLDGQWRFHRRTETETGGNASIQIDTETMQRLKSLGYVGE
ncbi:MAG TPA: sulfatase [Candidatus Limnocylindrales bacterium]|nr:sulfatase [Candidatus Limnocylindrales bacterium]